MISWWYNTDVVSFIKNAWSVAFYTRPSSDVIRGMCSSSKGHLVQERYSGTKSRNNRILYSNGDTIFLIQTVVNGLMRPIYTLMFTNARYAFVSTVAPTGPGGKMNFRQWYVSHQRTNTHWYRSARSYVMASHHTSKLRPSDIADYLNKFNVFMRDKSDGNGKVVIEALEEIFRGFGGRFKHLRLLLVLHFDEVSAFFIASIFCFPIILSYKGWRETVACLGEYSLYFSVNPSR